MIAPIDRSISEAGRKTRTLHSARRAAAAALLKAQSQPAKPVSRRQAWLFVAWTVITGTTYFAHMLGLID